MVIIRVQSTTLLIFQYSDLELACLKNINIVFIVQLYLVRFYVIILVEYSFHSLEITC